MEDKLKVGDTVFSADSTARERYGPGPFTIAAIGHYGVNVTIMHPDGRPVMNRDNPHFSAYATRFRKDQFLEEVWKTKNKSK